MIDAVNKGYTDGKCLVKIFSHEHKHNYPLSDFGSMGEHYGE